MDSPPIASTSGLPASSRARSRPPWHHETFAFTKSRPIPPELRALCRSLFEADVSCQIAAERATACTLAVVRHIVQMRLEHGWSTQYMAELLTKSHDEYVDIERETTVPKSSTLKRMIDVFGYDYPHTPKIFVSRPKHNIKKGTRRR